MLSNPTTSLHQRQRQHRRQQSTPTAFDTSKVPNLPTIIQKRASHRRGMSLDQRPRPQSPSQDHVGIITNQGFQQKQQHILREAQQQRLARPGQLQQSPYLTYTHNNDENYLISPLVSPQRQDFDPGYMNNYGASCQPTQQYLGFSGQIDTTIKVNTSEFSHGNSFISDSYHGLPLTPSTFLDFSAQYDDVAGQQDWGMTIKPSTRQSSRRRISGGIANRVAQFENMAEQPVSRPTTPPNHNGSNYFPLTPATTPYNRNQKSQPVPRRFQESYDTSMEETIKPRNKSNQRAKTVFQDMRDQVEMSQPLSPSSTNALPDLRSFDSAKMPSSKFMSMPNIDLNYMKQEGAFEPQPTYYSPEKSNISPELSEQPSPQTSHAVLFENQTVEQPCGPAYMEPSSSVTELCQNSSPNEDSTLEFQMRRSESVDSLIVEETITETGITIDDIAHYIDGPDPVDQKWLCLYPDCKKRFGRKENIKSHVQTHLGDRQFQCPHCKKCFVRQHDLKRHAKIHSGVKPYPCLCGNSFARHDALTRHRQRGMCIGAFEGVVKKVVKRGRPRKNRPDNEERIEKSSRTRSKNKAMSQSSASEYSESSYGQSPPGDFEVLDDKPFGDFTDSVMMDASNFQFPSSSGAADYIQPVATQSAPSPSDHSIYSQQSHHSHFSNHRGSVASIASTHLPTNPPSPARSVASISRSQYNTPPELCLSSSSPAPNTRFYDASEHGDDLDLTKLAHMHMDLEQDDDMFLNTFGEDDMSRLEQDPDMLLMGGKFDDAFATALGNDQGLGMGMEMFSGNAVDDVFFGSP